MFFCSFAMHAYKHVRIYNCSLVHSSVFGYAYVSRGSRRHHSRTHFQVVVVAENWQRPDVFGHGREKTHVTMFPFESRELALLGNLEHSERFLSLDGLFRGWGLGLSV